jgi:hypothetical protein
MSILIKGMRMPENCIKCPMQFGGMCYVMPAEVDESRVAPTVEEAWKKGKPDWCPLVEIPEPHGERVCEDEVVSCLEGAEWINEVIRIFLDLQAEGSEDE